MQSGGQGGGGAARGPVAAIARAAGSAQPRARSERGGGRPAHADARPGRAAGPRGPAGEPPEPASFQQAIRCACLAAGSCAPWPSSWRARPSRRGLRVCRLSAGKSKRSSMQQSCGWVSCQRCFLRSMQVRSSMLQGHAGFCMPFRRQQTNLSARPAPTEPFTVLCRQDELHATWEEACNPKCRTCNNKDIYCIVQAA